MFDLNKLADYLSKLLDTASFSDYCVNGIQVEGQSSISKIVTGVSASQRIIEAAIERQAQAVMLHHGLFWKNDPHPMALTGIMKDRIKLLLDNDISLLGYHLPLDAHQDLGNNALIGKALELENIIFIPVSDIDNPIAAVGDLSEPISFESFREKADEILDTNGLGLDFNKREIKRIFILSGGGGRFYQDAAEAGADLMITGELTEQNVRAAEELEISLYAAGHYNSEKWGIKALGEHLRHKFDLEVEFVDIPNPV
ncbi:MAG: Nif3-like dinuclear metal center hexameric protein [Candidatus Hatepunaea meridiana]|nr:Nif3-like dinuclear metal center hexameric protein [Candidatus Hatepunaea meridiana]